MASKNNISHVQEHSLVKIFGSTTKALSLWAIIDSPSRWMSVAQIADYADLSKGAVNRQIPELADAGIVEVKNLGGGRAFHLRDTKLGDAVRNLKEADEEAFKQVLSSAPELEILAAMQLRNNNQADASALVDLTGLGKSTVYKHLPELVEADVIIEDRLINGTQLYALNRNEFCKRFLELTLKLNSVMPEPVPPEPPV